VAPPKAGPFPSRITGESEVRRPNLRPSLSARNPRILDIGAVSKPSARPTGLSNSRSPPAGGPSECRDPTRKTPAPGCASGGWGRRGGQSGRCPPAAANLVYRIARDRLRDWSFFSLAGLSTTMGLGRRFGINAFYGPRSLRGVILAVLRGDSLAIGLPVFPCALKELSRDWLSAIGGVSLPLRQRKDRLASLLARVRVGITYPGNRNGPTSTNERAAPSGTVPQ
jgi:hypothetical protein